MGPICVPYGSNQKMARLTYLKAHMKKYSTKIFCKWDFVLPTPTYPKYKISRRVPFSILKSHIYQGEKPCDVGNFFISEERSCLIFQQIFQKDWNAKRIKLDSCWSRFSFIFVFHHSDKKPLAEEIIAFFRLLYFHNV